MQAEACKFAKANHLQPNSCIEPEVSEAAQRALADSRLGRKVPRPQEPQR